MFLLWWDHQVFVFRLKYRGLGNQSKGAPGFLSWFQISLWNYGEAVDDDDDDDDDNEEEEEKEEKGDAKVIFKKNCNWFFLLYFLSWVGFNSVYWLIIYIGYLLIF